VAPAAAYPEAAVPTTPAARVQQNMASQHQAGRIELKRRGLGWQMC
jgi:hypothetical protein